MPQSITIPAGTAISIGPSPEYLQGLDCFKNWEDYFSRRCFNPDQELAGWALESALSQAYEAGYMQALKSAGLKP